MMCCSNCCTHPGAEDIRRAEREAEAAHGEMEEMRAMIEDHRRGVVDDADLYALVDRWKFNPYSMWRR